jgi:methylenetetrahydrofolate reductase (NADPH)
MLNHPIVHYRYKPQNFFYRFLYNIFLNIERIFKEVVFGCSMCGQCILSYTGFTCPMRCPKTLRNGPCGGYDKNGKCEVDPNRNCVWILIYKRAKMLHRLEKMKLFQQPVNHTLFRSSAYVNHFTGRDKMPVSSLPGFALIRSIVMKRMAKKHESKA